MRPVRKRVAECLRCGRFYDERPPKPHGCPACGNDSFFWFLAPGEGPPMPPPCVQLQGEGGGAE